MGLGQLNFTVRGKSYSLRHGERYSAFKDMEAFTDVHQLASAIESLLRGLPLDPGENFAAEFQTGLFAGQAAFEEQMKAVKEQLKQ